MFKKGLICGIFLSVFAYGDQDGHKQRDDKEKLYLSTLTHFMRSCFTTDSHIYQQHKRALLNSGFPVIYDIPQMLTELPLTTTNLEIFNIKGLSASLQLTNQKQQAKCSLVIEGIDYQDAELMENLMEENYGLYLQNIGQDSSHKYWQYLRRDSDLAIISLYPSNMDNKSKILELAKNFEILPVRIHRPLNQADLKTYMQSEDHMVAFSLYLFTASPYWKNWVKQMDSVTVLTKVEANKAENIKLYLVSRKPKFEVRLIQEKSTDKAIILLNNQEYDKEKMKKTYAKRLPLFFDDFAELAAKQGEYAAWRGSRNGVSQDIIIREDANKQQFTITFSQNSEEQK